MTKRYIFYGGTRERNQDSTVRQVGVAHNGAFYHGATNVRHDYTDGNIKFLKITNAEQMLKELNGNAKESVSSLDILSHCTPYSLNFSEVENENCGIVTGFMAKMMLKIYYSTWEDGIYAFNIHSRYVSDIDFSIFTKDTRLQIHGCNTARGSIPGDTLTEALSKELHEAGKTSAYVIGHTTKSSPLIKGGKTSIKDQDYRHGERAVIVNGKIIYKTTSIGLLKHNEVLNRIAGGGL